MKLAKHLYCFLDSDAERDSVKDDVTYANSKIMYNDNNNNNSQDRVKFYVILFQQLFWSSVFISR